MFMEKEQPSASSSISSGHSTMRNRFRHHQAAILLGLTGALLSPGCAHNRDAYYPNSRGVHVRSPFVNLHVPAGPPVHVDATGSMRSKQIRQAHRLPEPPLLLDEEQ